MTNILIRNFKNRIFITQARRDLLRYQKYCIYDILLLPNCKYCIYEIDREMLFVIEYKALTDISKQMYDLQIANPVQYIL
jgi:hypothetical protein